MGKLLAFFKRNSSELLFLLLQVIAFSILVNTKSFHRSQFSHVTAKWSGWWMEKRNIVDRYFSLQHQNEVLQRENAHLRSIVNEGYVLDQPIYFPVADRHLMQQYRIFPGIAVNRSFKKNNNAIMIDKGSRHGVRPGMAVIGPKGVVGVVKDVTDRYASALTIIHSKFRLSVKLKQNDFFGTLLWDGRDYRYAQITDFPQHTDISLGDTIVTDTRSSVFPAGIPVGRVVAFEHNPTGDFIETRVKLFTDFSALSAVYLVEDVLLEERKKLEQLEIE
ncbi:MAG: rod shape-determining protein MreC [Cryomorphaceae bacterium]|nr:rod shape-determining protein MreC [Cryomorphaceae bacterium]